MGNVLCCVDDKGRHYEREDKYDTESINIHKGLLKHPVDVQTDNVYSNYLCQVNKLIF